MSIIQGNSKTSAAGYNIAQSIRFNADDSAYLTRTPSSAGNRRTFTLSTWVKFNEFRSDNIVFSSWISSGASAYALLYMHSDFRVRFEDQGGTRIKPSMIFRDPAAWYHIVLRVDTTDSIANNRYQMYVNGERQTDLNENVQPALNFETNINKTQPHYLGRNGYSLAMLYSDLYQAETHFIDGTALDASSFGEINADTGQWVPIKYTGSYGTNGFYITGADSADLGADDSGNGNDFTSSGLAAADQVSDSPTYNFWTLNILDSGGTLANGNLQNKGGSSTNTHAPAFPTTGKWYVEINCNDINTGTAGAHFFGICDASVNYNQNFTDHAAISAGQQRGGQLKKNNSNTSTGTAVNDGDIIALAFDADNLTLDLYVNNSQSGSQITGLTDVQYKLWIQDGASVTDMQINFGQTGGFTYTPPAGFSALSTANLPDPTIALPEKYFNTVLYEGNGGGQRVGQFQPITETYTVPNSVIFNDDDSAYLDKTFSSGSTVTQYTVSCWVKRGNLGGYQYLFDAGGNYEVLRFYGVTNIDSINFEAINGHSVYTNAVFKDVGAWYHIVAVLDSPNAVDTDRIRIYVNGERQSVTLLNSYPTQNETTLRAGGAFAHGVAARSGGVASTFFDGYIAEYHCVFGQALDPDSFGQLDASTNKWIPKAYSGSYGTNGFYLDMETAPGTGSGAGTDSSGNGNNFTESGLDAVDQVDDSPTENFCTLNPNDSYGSGLTLSDGNLRAVPSAAAYCNNHGTIYVGSGKWVYEVKHTTVFGEAVGWSPLGETINGSSQRGWFMFNDGRAYINTTNQGTLGTSLSSGDYRYIFYDADKKAMWFAHCDVSSGTPTTLVYENGATKAEIESGDTSNAVFTGIDPVDLAPGIWMDSSGVIETNFGQSSFYTTSTLPTGFNTLNNDNLPLSNGDLSAFVWIKNRDAADNHMLFDAVRGVTKDVHSNSTAAEVTNANTLTRFLKNGFEVSNNAEVNTSGESYVAWQWLTDSLTTSTNEDGSTTSTVLADTTSGFSIVSYTGTGSAATVGHGLGVAPSMIIAKNRSTTSNWSGYHVDLGATKTINLNETAAAQTSSGNWNNTEPTTSVFSVNTSTGTNGSGNSIVAYCFAEVEGFSKFGSYTGNGSTDGAFIYTGFKPAFVMYKRTNTTESWEMYDTTRLTYNPYNANLRANLTNTEQNDLRLDILSNGFKARSSNTAINASGSTYIYMAFARSPFKTATAR